MLNGTNILTNGSKNTIKLMKAPAQQIDKSLAILSIQRLSLMELPCYAN